MNEMNDYTGRRPFIDPRNFDAEYAEIFDSRAHSAHTLEEAMEVSEYLGDFGVETRVRVEEEDGFAAMLSMIGEEARKDRYNVYVRNGRSRDAAGLLRVRGEAR